MTGQDDGRRAPEREVALLRQRLSATEARLARLAGEYERDDAQRRHLAAIVEASRDAIWSWSPDGTITSWNAEAERLLGYTAAEIVGRSLFELVPAERRELARRAMASLRDGGWYRAYDTERVHKDGRPIPVELTVSPIRDASGAFVAAATVCRDISDRKRLEARQELLVRELDHRVRNTLSTVLALLHQTRRASDDADALASALERRLRTLLTTHAALLENRFVGARLRDLVQHELGAFVPDGGDGVALDGDDLYLRSHAAQLICLAVHELATNAARHGALRTAGGRARLLWRLTGDGRLVRLVWQEEGCRLAGQPPPSRYGFGRTLLERGLAGALGGSAKLEFAAQGVRYELLFPADDHLVSEAERAEQMLTSAPPAA